MTACYGHRWSVGRSRRCARCGHDYWEHSHLETFLDDGRIRRSIIAYGGIPYRTVYDRMMDRTIGVCDWYKLRAAQEVEKQADALIAYANTPLDKVYSSEEVWWAREQTEPVEVTTWSDFAQRCRRYLNPNGSITVVSTKDDEP